MNSSDIDAIVIHCSETREDQPFYAEDIDKWHKEKGWTMIGYHYVIDLDGTVEIGRPLPMDGAHCNTSGFSGKSYNKHSVGICYIGGLSKDGKAPKDTRTAQQKASMLTLVKRLCEKFPIKEILGHRDTYSDINKNGKVDKEEWLKSCPCFEVKEDKELMELLK